MAKRHSKHVKRTRKHRGGSQGSGYEPGGALLRGVQLDAQIVKPYDACMTVARPGQMAFSSMGGLPGMRGGAYTNNLDSGIAGFAQVDKVACQPNLTNPLNQRGGVGLQSAQDMGVYEAPTARYAQAASSFTNSVGAPILLNQPLDARMWSRACTQTAGGFLRKRQQKTKSHKKSKKSRKTRKSGARRYRKHRGGGLREDALGALAAAGQTPDSVSGQSYQPGLPGKEIHIGGFTFKHQAGFYNSQLLAKLDGSHDSTYVEVATNYLGSQ